MLVRLSVGISIFLGSVISQTSVAGEHEIKGSDTLFEVMTQLIEQAELQGEMEYLGGGSSTAARALLAGEQNIAPMSRAMKPEEKQSAADQGIELTETVVALDSVNIFIRFNNLVKNLSVTDLADIYTCKVTSWSAYGGTGTIKPFARDDLSGTTEVFKKLTGAKEYGSCVTVVETSAEIAKKTASVSGSIGYAGSDAKNSTNKILAISSEAGADAYAPTIDNIRSFDYPLARNLYIYWTASLDDHESMITDLILDREVLDPIVEAAGFISVD